MFLAPKGSAKYFVGSVSSWQPNVWQIVNMVDRKDMTLQLIDMETVNDLKDSEYSHDLSNLFLPFVTECMIQPLHVY